MTDPPPCWRTGTQILMAVLPPLLGLRLRAVLGPALLAPRHTGRIQRPADDVISHSREVFHTTPADEHDRVLLQIVALARDVAGDLQPVREPHARHLAQRRIRLLW